MSFLSELKAIFNLRDKPKPIEPEVEPAQEEVQPERKVLENCIICGDPVYEDERFRDFNGHKVHKRCFKRTQRAMLNGEAITQ